MSQYAGRLRPEELNQQPYRQSQMRQETKRSWENHTKIPQCWSIMKITLAGNTREEAHCKAEQNSTVKIPIVEKTDNYGY